MKTLRILLLLSAALVGVCQGQVCTRSLSGVNYQSGTSYTFVDLDTTRAVYFSNLSPVAVTLPSGVTSSALGSCSELLVVNGGAGTVTITCSSCTINGSATLALGFLQSADIYGDGLNYVAALGGSGGGGGTGANTALSNLVSPALNLAPSPASDNSIALNARNKRWTEGWFGGVIGNANSGTPFAGISFANPAGVPTMYCGNGTATDVTCSLLGAIGLFSQSLGTGSGSAACGSAGAILCFVESSTGTPQPLANNSYLRFDLNNHAGYASLNGSTEFQWLKGPRAEVLSVATDFTTANNTNLQLITGLTKTMLASYSGTVNFRCNFVFSQGTATAVVAFGVQGATTAPTNLLASGTIYPNTTTLTSGTLTGLNTTTATAVVSVAPSAITTKWRAVLDGTMEYPSNASPTVLNIMVSTATGADAVTVYRDSSCVLTYQ